MTQANHRFLVFMLRCAQYVLPHQPHATAKWLAFLDSNQVNRQQLSSRFCSDGSIESQLMQVMKVASIMMVETIGNMIATIRKQGTTVLLVEQNASLALRLADRAYVLETGRVMLSGSARELAANPEVHRAYLGG